MAIAKNMAVAPGFELPCYLLITQLAAHKVTGGISVHVDFYASKARRLAHGAAVQALIDARAAAANLQKLYEHRPPTAEERPALVAANAACEQAEAEMQANLPAAGFDIQIPPPKAAPLLAAADLRTAVYEFIMAMPGYESAERAD